MRTVSQRRDRKIIPSENYEKFFWKTIDSDFSECYYENNLINRWRRVVLAEPFFREFGVGATEQANRNEWTAEGKGEMERVVFDVTPA